MKNRLSICMATYNGQSFIKKQLESIISQIGKNDEIIISDDNSTDNTLDIIKSFNDNRIKLFINHNIPRTYNININDKRKRIIANFENALKQATGDIIFLSDQDDIWYSNKVAIAINELKKYDLIVSDCKIIDENDNILINSRFKTYKPKTGIINTLVQNPVLGCCTVFKREILNYALPFPRNIGMHDIWIGMVAQIFFKVKLIEEPLVGYRKHKNNIVNNSDYASKKSLETKSPNNIFKKLSFRVGLLINVIKLVFKIKLKGI